MTQLTLEQQKAVAIASARRRRMEAAPPEMQQQAIAPEQATAPKPEPLPTKAFPLSREEAARRYNRFGLLDVLYGAATAEPSVTSELLAEPIKRAGEMITGLPGFASQVGSAFWDNLKGVYGGQPEALSRGAEKSSQLASGVWEGVKQAATETPKAIGTTLQGAGALIAPETIPMPSEERMREAAGVAPFAALTAATGGPAVLQAGRGVARYVRNAPVRKGYTQLGGLGNPLKPEPQPVPKVGVHADRVPLGATPKYEPEVRGLSKALQVERLGEEAAKMEDAINAALPNIKHAQQNNPFQMRPFKSLKEFGNTLKWGRTRIWEQSINPLFTGKMETAPIKQRFINNVNPVIKQFFPEAVDPIIKKFGDIFDAYPEMSTAAIEELAATLRAQLDIPKGPFAMFDEMAGSKTATMKALEDAVRDSLYEHVNLTHNTDIRPAMRAYGDLSGIERLVRDVPEPTSFIEKALSTYTFPTKRAIAARLGEQSARQLMGTMWRLNRALGKYKLDPSLVTPIAEPRFPMMYDLPSMKPTVAEQLTAAAKSGRADKPLPSSPPIKPPEFSKVPDALPRDPITGELLIPESWNYERLHKDIEKARVRPPETLTGTQASIAENVLPESSGQPGKPGEFFPGKQGVHREVIGTNPVTGKPIKQPRLS